MWNLKKSAGKKKKESRIIRENEKIERKGKIWIKKSKGRENELMWLNG